MGTAISLGSSGRVGASCAFIFFGNVALSRAFYYGL